MGRKDKDASFLGSELPLTPQVSLDPHEFHPPEDELESSDETEREEDTDSGEEGEQSGDSGGGGGGVTFDETEDDFDPTELQGLPIPTFRKALKTGLGLVSRVTKQSENYLRNFLPDKSLRSRVIEAALSERGHPTLLLDKGEIVQYQLSKGKLERVRVSPDLDAERAVKYAMAGFIAAGESLNPRHVKFGRSPEFEARMKPIWVREWKRMQRDDNKLSLDALRKAVSFKRAVDTQTPARPSHPQAQAMTMAEAEMRQQPAARSILDIPRAGAFGGPKPEV